jgi:hypothetical protein
MTFFKCPDGHDSTNQTECSVCGAQIDSVSSPGNVAAPVVLPADNTPNSDAPCGACGAARENKTDEVCPNCGAEYSSGKVELPKVVAPLADLPIPAASNLAVPEPLAQDQTATGPRLVAAVTIDLGPRDGRPDDAVPPTDRGERIFELTGAFISFGRSKSANIMLPNDAGMSRMHGEFVRLPDNTYGVRDGIREGGTHHPSANGTELNGALMPGAEVRRIKTDDVLKVGFYQLITIRQL